MIYYFLFSLFANDFYSHSQFYELIQPSVYAYLTALAGAVIDQHKEIERNLYSSLARLHKCDIPGSKFFTDRQLNVTGTFL